MKKPHNITGLPGNRCREKCAESRLRRRPAKWETKEMCQPPKTITSSVSLLLDGGDEPIQWL